MLKDHLKCCMMHEESSGLLVQMLLLEVYNGITTLPKNATETLRRPLFCN